MFKFLLTITFLILFKIWSIFRLLIVNDITELLSIRDVLFILLLFILSKSSKFSTSPFTIALKILMNFLLYELVTISKAVWSFAFFKLPSLPFLTKKRLALCAWL